MAATFAYVSSTGSGEIAVFALDAAAGTFDRVQTVSFFRGTESSPLAISPDKRFLYVGVRSRPFEVIAYAIEPETARLRRIGEAPLPASLCYVALDRSGKYLLGASYPQNSIVTGTIGPDGVPRNARQVMDGLTNAHAIVPDRNNRFLLVPALGLDEVRVFAFKAGIGAITAHGHAALPEGTGPRHLDWHPRLDLVYVLGEHDAHINAMAYDPETGTLTPKYRVAGKVAAKPPSGTWSAADIHVTPDGRFLYASVRRDSTLLSFSLDAHGAPTLLGEIETEERPRSFAIDPSGRFLLVAGQDSGSVALYAIDGATGALKLLGRSPVGPNASWVEFIDLS